MISFQTRSAPARGSLGIPDADSQQQTLSVSNSDQTSMWEDTVFQSASPSKTQPSDQPTILQNSSNVLSDKKPLPPDMKHGAGEVGRAAIFFPRHYNSIINVVFWHSGFIHACPLVKQPLQPTARSVLTLHILFGVILSLAGNNAY